MERQDLYEIIQKEIVAPKIPIKSKLKKCIAYQDENLELILLYQYFSILKNYYKIYRIIDNKLEKIPELFNVLEIIELNITEQQLELLISHNVFTMKNLKQMPIDVLICIFCNDLEGFIQEISQYAIKKEEIIQQLEQKIKQALKPEWTYVLEKRIDLENYKKRTLAEIGNEMNLTRERIRQVEKKAIQKMKIWNKQIEQIVYCFYKDIDQEDKKFITIKAFLKYIKNEDLTKYLIVWLDSKETGMRINNELEIIYNNEENSLEEIVAEAQRRLSDIMSIEEVANCNEIQKYIIEQEYKTYQSKIWVRKKTNISSIYKNEIKEKFVEGYNIGSEEDYQKLLGFLTEKYGNIEMPSKHSIQAMIDRYDFIQVDRGTYRAREYTVILPEKLTDKIIQYIIENSPIVHYSSIFEQFKTNLYEVGINNRFYLKGVLDEKLPKEFSVNRDFINTNSEENINAYDVMRDLFKTFEAEFTIEDISKKMPGLKKYNYENYVKAESANGLIQIATRTYIYIDKLNITKETQTELKEYIDNLFLKMDSKILTAKKIYANLSIMNPELLSKLHITARFGDFELFSILQYLFKDDYYYSRPIISLEKNQELSSYWLIKEYAKRFEQFNYTDIKNYIYKMNLGGIYSYINFMEDMSDDYVQINIDSMIKMEKLEIKKEKLGKIKEFIDLLLKSNEFRTDNFDGYFMLPKLNRPWNKYLLIGIIRSYFKEEYKIENTTNFYDTTDFIVRRI